VGPKITTKRPFFVQEIVLNEFELGVKGKREE